MSSPLFKEVDLSKLLKEHKISQATFDKVTNAKRYIEHKYNLKTVKNTEWNEINTKLNSLNISESDKEKVRQEIFAQEATKYRKAREKQTVRDYNSIAIIGRGAFGEVHVCEEIKTKKIVAIKKIRKDVLVKKNQILHVRNEQILMKKIKSEWIVDLKASFQEDEFLYLVMEFCPGGDLMNLLIKKDIFTENEARFYTAEMIMAIEAIHKLDCIHRDIKPDNVLIDKYGHIKLTDFGLAKVSDNLYTSADNKPDVIDEEKENEKKKHVKNYSIVGTAYYVAPEVLNKKGYGPEIDWWSVGVIFFEMLVGYAPFCSEETSEVCNKVLNWKKYLKIPSKAKVSRDAEDLIMKMINSPNIRLGSHGAEEIKSHPFFKGIDWNNLRKMKAPFIPELKNDWDTSYFEVFEEKEPFYPVKKKNRRKDIEYIGYTYKDSDEEENNLGQEFESAIKIAGEYSKNINNDNVEKEIITDCPNSNIITNSNNENEGDKKIMKKIIFDNNQMAIMNNKGKIRENSVGRCGNKSRENEDDSSIRNKGASPQPKANFLIKRFGLNRSRSKNKGKKTNDVDDKDKIKEVVNISKEK